MTPVNLTPHTLTLCDGEGNTLVQIEPSGDVARIEVDYTQAESVTLDGTDVPVFQAQYGDVENLPEPENGVLYIVSGMVADQVDRADVVSPGELIRDDEGQPVGSKGLKE